MNTRDYTLEAYRRHVNSGMARLGQMMGLPVEVRSSGSLVFDDKGEAYLDCGGYGVFLVGHCHPVVVAAVAEQLARHPLATRTLLSPELAAAAESLSAVSPAGMSYVFFCNSGAEATEAGLKIARLNGRSKLIVMEGGYHGKTLGALSITGRTRYRTPFEPLLSDVRFLPFGAMEPLRQALREEGEQACVVLEPVQAEAGVIVPPGGYLREVKGLCLEHGAYLMLDEIQTGLGRLGAWWGADLEQVVPDILLVGKGLSGGCVPVAATVATTEAFAALNRDPPLHTSTFGGNPLAMAAAKAAIDVIQKENLVVRSRELGTRLLRSLRTCIEDHSPTLAAKVQGLGLLIGIEFPVEHVAADFILELLRRRVIVSTSLNSYRVVRLTPPAVLTDAEVDWLLTAVGEAAQALSRRWEGARQRPA